MRPSCWPTAAHAAHSVRASAPRPVAAHRSPALGYAREQLKPAASAHREVEHFPQVRRGVAGRGPPPGPGPGPRPWAARPPGSTGRPRPGPGPGTPRRRARLRPGPRHRPARWSAQPLHIRASRAGDPGRDLSGLPGQPYRIVVIAGVIGGETELGQGQQLPDRVRRSPGPAPASGGRRRPPRQSGPSAAMLLPGRPGQSASARDGGRSPAASQTAVKWPSAPARSAENCAARPSQNCAAHHPSLPGTARPATSRSSGY